jgi:hypothetical protein
MNITGPIALPSGGYTFTGIPASKFLALALNGIKISVSSSLRVRLGIASGLVTTGYDSESQSTVTTQSFLTSTVDFAMIYAAGAQQPLSGNMLFALTDPANNFWSVIGNWASRLSQHSPTMTGRVPLGGVLTQLSIYPNGSDTFTGGSVALITG